MQIRTYVGISLDGFVAPPDGLPTWEASPEFNPGEHGYPELMGQCGAIAMGRTCFDQGLEDDDWPWEDMPVYVLTSRPLPANAPASVIASKGGPAGLVEQLRESGIERDVQLLGGPRAIRAFLDLGAIDRLGMCVLPVLLGKGIPLFAIEPTTFSNDAWTAKPDSRTRDAWGSFLRLEQHKAYPSGAVDLVYTRNVGNAS